VIEADRKVKKLKLRKEADFQAEVMRLYRGGFFGSVSKREHDSDHQQHIFVTVTEVV
jgi:hypothetical protein